MLGENGAGKSTLVSILFGHYVADAGQITVFGKPLEPGDPKAALAAGIGMVHQHFTLADNLTVLDNIVMGSESAVASLHEPRRSAARGCARWRNDSAWRSMPTPWSATCRSVSANGSKFSRRCTGAPAS